MSERNKESDYEHGIRIANGPAENALISDKIAKNPPPNKRQLSVNIAQTIYQTKNASTKNDLVGHYLD